jgi:hypothetical protein
MGTMARVILVPADSIAGVPDARIVRATFLRVPEAKTTKNRLHLDLRPVGCGQAVELGRLLKLGARLVDIGQGEQDWFVLADPEGNEFCVLTPR